MQPGLFYAIIAFVTWGFFPLYWKELTTMPALELMSFRIIFTFLTCLVLLTFSKEWKNFIALIRDKRYTKKLTLGTISIFLNWFLFIYAVNTNHVLQSSLGYFLGPLFSVAFGVFFLKEKLRTTTKISLALATAGLCILVSKIGHFPWLSLAIGSTFAYYGMIKKGLPFPPLLTLSYETLLLFPLCAGLVCSSSIWGPLQNFETTDRFCFFILFSGIITYIPLHLFSKSAQLISLTSMGMLQFITPSLQFLLAVFLYKEEFSYQHMFAYLLIWSALFFFILDKVRTGKQKLK